MKTITAGLQQGSSLSTVLFNVYTVGIISSPLEAPGETLSFADYISVYCHGSDREEIRTELYRLDGWCDQFKGIIYPDKSGVKSEHLKYLGITFNRNRCGRDHINLW